VSGLADEPSVEELLEQIKSIKLGQFLLSTAATLASLAFGKIGERDLDEARLAIDAMAAIVPLLEGKIDDEARRGLDQALTNLRLAYAEAAAAPPSEPSE
jgi:hypothetical protein